MASEKNSADYMMDDLHISDTVDLLIPRKDEISIRFSVEVRIEKPAESLDDGCWVNILGQEAKVKAAKQYIKNLCNPEVTETVNYPAEFHSRISDKAVVFELEKKHRAVVQFNDGENPEDDGEAVVRGDGLAVALTLSAIEDRITTYMEQSRLSMGDLPADTTSGHSSYPHTSGYSDNTSHRLNDTLKGMSGQLDVANQKLHYETKLTEQQEQITRQQEQITRQQTQIDLVMSTVTVRNLAMSNLNDRHEVLGTTCTNLREDVDRIAETVGNLTGVVERIDEQFYPDTNAVGRGTPHDGGDEVIDEYLTAPQLATNA